MFDQLENIEWDPEKTVRDVMLCQDFDQEIFWQACRLRLEQALAAYGLRDAAEDAFQETYVHFLEKQPETGSFRRFHNFAAYFTKSGVYNALRHSNPLVASFLQVERKRSGSPVCRISAT
ncbi:MAG: hypothetical protein AAF483_00420 [Planctomycetota bacterium]